MSRVKVYKPTTNARRRTSVINYKEVLTTDKPYKKLLSRKVTQGGRNNSGKITVRHQGGGARQLVREIDFKRKFPQGFKLLTVEYDPNRSAFISLVSDLASGDKSYILYTKGMSVGQKYGLNKEISEGNLLELKDIPLGTNVSQVELQPGQGAKLARSAGDYAIVTASDGNLVTLKLPSGERRKILGNCTCVIGRVGNEASGLVRVGKAGRQRHKGIRPTVRGKVMNPTDHPHGGGEARNPVGMPYPKTPWGKHALGVKTRKSKSSDKFIVSRRARK
jgi:large subunit ribosomal protein L2